MNSDSPTPPFPAPGSPAPAFVPKLPSAAIDWQHWARRLLVCNPFFLCSVALLLFSLDKLTGDPGFLDGNETHQLVFVFFALQIYELIVTGTAVVLGRRQIWYDSALLTVLDHGLVLVPFMMMSQAVLTSWPLTILLAATGGAMAATRVFAVRKWNPRFNLPPRALALGAALLLLNLALPVWFRSIVNDDYEFWAGPNLWLWLVALPLLAAAANLLPRPTRYGGLELERPWLPLFLFGLWLTGTAVHVWSVGYVARLNLPLPLLAPLAVALAWTLFNRIADCVREPSWRWGGALLLLVFAAPVLALLRPEIFHPLALLNLAGFVVLMLKAPGQLARVARGFVLASVPLLIAGISPKWLAPISAELARVNPLSAALALLIAGAAFHSVRWQFGAFGAVTLALAMAGGYPHVAGHAALQTGIVFLFLHSFRWVADECADHRALRWCLAAAWTADAAVWTRVVAWEPAIFTTLAAALVAVTALVLWLRWKLPVPLALWAGCAGASLAAPGNWFIANSRPGLLALAGSLGLFALGTALAWTRHRWEQRIRPPGST